MSETWHTKRYMNNNPLSTIMLKVIKVWSDGQSHLADVKYRTLISKFDVEQHRPIVMIQQRGYAIETIAFRGLSQ